MKSLLDKLMLKLGYVPNEPEYNHVVVTNENYTLVFYSLAVKQISIESVSLMLHEKDELLNFTGNNKYIWNERSKGV